MITKKRNTGRGNATRPPKVVPKVSLKGPPILVDRLQFSADGRVLVASGEALEAYGWDLASRKPVVKQSMDHALEDLEALDLDNMEFGPTLTAAGRRT